MRIAEIVATVLTVLVILRFGFGPIVWLLAVVLGLYVLIAMLLPVIVYAFQRMLERPEVRPIERDDPSIPDSVTSHLTAAREALVARGFEHRGMIHQPGAKTPSAYIEHFRHPESSAGALSRVLLNPRHQPPRVLSADVELEMRYDDGTVLELSNVATVIPGLESFPGLVAQMPNERDAGKLADYFFKLVTRRERETNKAVRSRISVPDDTSLTDIYYDQIKRGYEIRERLGLVQRTAKPGVWRPTWRLAVRTAALSVSPGLEFSKRRLRVRGERLRRELDGNPALSRSERIGARMGWIMLALGIPLGALALVFSWRACALVWVGIMAGWWIAKRRSPEPTWRAIVAGGIGAMLLLGIPLSFPWAYVPGTPGWPPSQAIALIGVELLPMALLTAASALMVEGFRAAAT